MTVSISPAQNDVNKVVGQFLQNILGSTFPVIVGEVNRVSQPQAQDYAIMWPILPKRLVTNIDDWLDTKFTGAIAGTTLTVSALTFGYIAAGDPLFGTGVAIGSSIVSQNSGTPGGIGTYTISPSQTISQETLAAGTKNITECIDLTMQIDVHGPNSPENAAKIMGAWRDQYACTFFASLNENITPIDADDPHQTPFINDQAQYEYRYVISVRLQVNQTITGLPQQFADHLSIATNVPIDVEYPAT